MVTMDRTDSIDYPINESARGASQNGTALGADGIGSVRVRRNRRRKIGCQGRAIGRIGWHGGSGLAWKRGNSTRIGMASWSDTRYAQLDENDCCRMCVCTHNAAARVNARAGAQGRP